MTANIPLVLAHVPGTSAPVNVRLYAAQDGSTYISEHSADDVHSPVDGTPMTPIGETIVTVTSEEVAGLLHAGTCQCGKETLVPIDTATDILNNDVASFHCTACGSQVTVAIDSAQYLALASEGAEMPDTTLPTAEVAPVAPVETAPVAVAPAPAAEAAPVAETAPAPAVTEPVPAPAAVETAPAPLAEAPVVEPAPVPVEAELLKEAAAADLDEALKAIDKAAEECDEPEEDDESEEGVEGMDVEEDAEGLSDEEVAAMIASIDEAALAVEDTAEGEEDEEASEEMETSDDEEITEDEEYDEELDDEDMAVDEDEEMETADVEAASVFDLAECKLDLVLASATDTYFVFADQAPVGLLQKEHASGEFQKIFGTDTYVRNFHDIASGRVEASIEEMGWQPYVFTVAVEKVAKQQMDKAAADVQATVEENVADHVEAIRQGLSIAALASIKGVWEDFSNPVRDDLVNTLQAVGVDQASVIVDTAFAKHGSAFVSSLLDHAHDIASKPLGLRNELAELVAKARFQVSNTTASALSKTLAEGSVRVSNQPTVPEIEVDVASAEIPAPISNVDRIRARLRRATSRF